MTPRPVAIAVAAVLSIAAARERDVSWGKAGVSYADYRRDARACGIGGATTDIRGRPATRDVLAGTENQDLALDRMMQRMIERGGRDPDEFNTGVQNYTEQYRRHIHNNVAETQAFLIDRVSQCLRQRGYVRFALTRRQDHALAKLARGSEARFTYLHSLASDPAVLAAQAVAPAATPADRSPPAD